MCPIGTPLIASGSPFGPATTTFFEVLLQIEVLVIDMQARMHAVLNHPGTKLSRRSLRHHAVKNQLHAVRAPRSRLSRMTSSKNSRPRNGRMCCGGTVAG